MNRIYLLFIDYLFFCSTGDESDALKEMRHNIIRSNLSLTIAIVSSNTSNPIGDGTGVITCSASAPDAVSYGFK